MKFSSVEVYSFNFIWKTSELEILYYVKTFFYLIIFVHNCIYLELPIVSDNNCIVFSDYVKLDSF